MRPEEFANRWKLLEEFIKQEACLSHRLPGTSLSPMGFGAGHCVSHWLRILLGYQGSGMRMQHRTLAMPAEGLGLTVLLCLCLSFPPFTLPNTDSRPK